MPRSCPRSVATQPPPCKAASHVAPWHVGSVELLGGPTHWSHSELGIEGCNSGSEISRRNGPRRIARSSAAAAGHCATGRAACSHELPPACMAAVRNEASRRWSTLLCCCAACGLCSSLAAAPPPWFACSRAPLSPACVPARTGDTDSALAPACSDLGVPAASAAACCRSPPAPPSRPPSTQGPPLRPVRPP